MWESQSMQARDYVNENSGIVGALVGMALSEKVHQYIDELDTIKLPPLVNDHYLEPYGAIMEAKGMDVNVVRLPVDPKKLRQKNHQDKQKSPYDFTHIRNEKNIDYVLFLDIGKFGIERSSNFGLTLGKPGRKTAFKLYLIDTKDNTVLGKYTYKKLDRGISKNWKENNYEQYKKDVAQLLIDGLQEAYFGFFEE